MTRTEDAGVTTDAVPVDEVRVHAFTVPTDGPDGKESDGTLEWDSTTMVLVEVRAGGQSGLGYTYGDVSTASFIESNLVSVVSGADAFGTGSCWNRMYAAIRNAGQPGLGSMAVAAVDIALWDLKARLLGRPLYRILPAAHDRVPVYGSGGFTNYPLERLVEQLAGWVEQGIPRVKLKTSRDPTADPERLARVRDAVGARAELFVDANGALSRKEALYWAHHFAGEWDVRWFEEPVSSLDTEGLRMVREHGPGRLEIAAGEYGYLQRDFSILLTQGAVDCLQADVTRCGGITGLLQVGGLAAAHQIGLSAHCAPAVSAHAFCAVPTMRHLEYFHDHVRIEKLAFDGTLTPSDGALRPDPHRSGLGLAVRWDRMERYRVHGTAPARTHPYRVFTGSQGKE
ncbi:MAG TPA: enolase C-terminal domain-like protein [Amycolatopsis sp.]|nr:enolase C-terminal domain-like protein [Amycolatopsis sp.]